MTTATPGKMETILRYFHLDSIHIVGERHYRSTGRDGAEVNTENHAVFKSTVVVIPRCCFAEDGEETYQRVGPMSSTVIFPHAYHLWRCRCNYYMNEEFSFYR